jgi:two-component system OmpR family response regulator
MADGEAIENFVRPGYQVMTLSSSKMIRPRPKARALSSGSSGGASNIRVEQAPAMWQPPLLRHPRELAPTWPPGQLPRDRSSAGNGRPVFRADDGAVVDEMDRQTRLLVVAQDSAMRDQMIDYLQRRVYAVSVATQQGALRQLAASEPDLIVLDIRLCQANGLDLLRGVRLASDVPLVIVGCHQVDAADRVIALELGADDYITDPIGLRELEARIRAVLRRYERRSRAPSDEPGRGRCRFSGWQLDRYTRRLTSPTGVPVALTKGEYTLLIAFLDAPLRPLTREGLLQATRVHEDLFDRTIDARVLRLRRKLETDAASPRLIRTERGVGYVFAVPVEHV